MSSSKKITIALIQERFQVGDVLANADKIIALSHQANQQGANLVVFPELALVGYPPEDLLHRPGFLKQCQDQCQRIVQELPACTVIFGLPIVLDEQSTVENRGANGTVSALLYNAAVCVQQNKIVATYHKRCLPNYSVFDEVRYFVAGNESVTVTINGVCVGLCICEDVWQQNIVAENVSAGVNLLLVLNASPFHVGKLDERVEVLQQRVAETGLPVLYVNMVGGQDELVFDGESLAVNKQQKLVMRAPAFEATQVFIEYADGDVAAKKLTTQDAPYNVYPIKPVLSNDAMIYNALVMGVRDFVHQNGFTGVVIGLSGGVDSALTLAIAVDALGAENVHAIMMPSRYTADMSQQDALAQAEKQGVQFDVLAIESVFETFLSTLAPVFNGAEVDVTEENLQARSRGVLLMAVSNKSGRMVLTTGNKSEMAVGYATLYGDMCGGFAPLKDVCKIRVYQLCRYRNEIESIIPERVLTRPPSAELREDQVDQDSLPDYEVLDSILELSVERDVPVDDIVAQGFDKETVLKVLAMVQRNEYKRRQSPPGIRITGRAFGRDRRYPITSGYRRQ